MQVAERHWAVLYPYQTPIVYVLLLLVLLFDHCSLVVVNNKQLFAVCCRSPLSSRSHPLAFTLKALKWCLAMLQKHLSWKHGGLHFPATLPIGAVLMDGAQQSSFWNLWDMTTSNPSIIIQDKRLTAKTKNSTERKRNVHIRTTIWH